MDPEVGSAASANPRAADAAGYGLGSPTGAGLPSVAGARRPGAAFLDPTAADRYSLPNLLRPGNLAVDVALCSADIGLAIEQTSDDAGA